MKAHGSRRKRLLLVVCLLLPLVTAVRAGQTGDLLDRTTIAGVVEEVAVAVAREYFDAAAGERIAATMRQHASDGRYQAPMARLGFATALTRDLVGASSDKHLAVTLQARPGTGGAPAVNRAEGVRRTNGGVSRVEILDGNIGYLNLTSFWRPDEARDILTLAMRLLARADALIIDLRQNTGGSPDTVAWLLGFFFDQSTMPLFEIVPRTGAATTYATPAEPPVDRNGSRPVFALTSSRTFSAGEGFAYLLQERARATIVGERTAGAANPGRGLPIRDGFELTVPNGQVRSAIRRGNWEGTGVVPDVSAPAGDALTVAHTAARSAVTR